jgi:predicted AAA+ superfamily ATPase
MKFLTRFFKPSTKSYFLFGPRGTGKSTLIKRLYKDAVIIDLLEPNLYRQYLAFPERLKGFVTANASAKTFVIDEVQKVPDLLSLIHQLIEEKQDRRFILTGSSARKLKRSGVDLLAGRAHLKTLHPFMAAEVDELFELEKALKWGMLPLVWDSLDWRADLKAYVALYMHEEVQMEGLVRRVDSFSRFIEIISFSQGVTLNNSNIARECQISSKTVENYIQILEDLLLSFRLNVFSKKAKRHLTQHAKFYYFDTGVYQSIRPMGPLDNPEVVTGHALETLVAQHLRAWVDYTEQESELFFWRSKSGLEVDFVVYGEACFYAIEVKNNSKVRPEDLRGLHEFKKDYPQSECLLLYRGSEKIMVNGIVCWPLEDFLLQLKPGQIIDEGIA